MKIGFIGCGNMASAMISGILKKGIVEKGDIIASNTTEASSARTKEKLGIRTTTDNLEVVRSSDIVFLAVKPYLYATVLSQVKEALSPEQIVVSMTPGKTLQWLDEQLGGGHKVVRIMPNTPILVGEGISGACHNEKVTEADFEKISTILNGFGKMRVVAESLMDVVSAVGGSSPAFVYMFIEAMADAAVAAGMPRAQAYDIAAQAVYGSAKMVLETGKHPGQLKDEVCSPAGSTIQGVRVLEEKGMRSAVIEGLLASIEKARSL